MEILIVGGGYVGMYTARRLERLLRPGEASVTVADPRGYMTYQPFLAEAAGGSIEPRHVIAPLPRVRILVGADLAVTGVPGVFAAGDIAAVPDLSRPGEYCAPNAQHAVRQSKVLARNIVAIGRGGQLKSYRHAYAGSVAGLGHHQGVAQVYRIRLTGFAGWLAHRVYHLFWVPTLSHKARVLADWTLALLFRRETAQLN
jgi:NADH:ubiquinone reductase (H+-translocating)